MVSLAPEWFSGGDVLIEIFILIVLIIFWILAFRGYKLNKNKNLLNLGIGFGLIALAQIACIATKFVIYYDTPITSSIGTMIIHSGVVNSVSILYGISFFFYRLFSLLGFYLIYRLPKEKKSSSGDFALVAFFILISAFISNELSYIFRLTTLFFLMLIVKSYYEIYKENKFLNTKILLIGFSLLALGNLILMFSHIGVMFVAGNMLELVGYTVFLGLIIKILKHGKKKGSHGDNFGYVGNHPRKK